MPNIAKVHSDRLKELKKSVEDAQKYFDENIKRFHEFVKFVFKTSMNDSDTAVLQQTGKPVLEFNIVESYVSRLRGEFAKQQPSLTVRAADGIPLTMLTREFTATIAIIEAHLRAIFFDGANDKLEYNIYTDLLAGGFSVMRVYTDYVNEMSFEQNICCERVFDPTLCGFDPLARESHKGDGKYCFELYPMTREQFKNEFGEEALEDMRFTRDLAGFCWSYKAEAEDVILVCDYYEKKKKREKIVKLTNGHTVTMKEFKRILEKWELENKIEQPPQIIGEPRMTDIESIDRYRFCETRVLDHIETNYKKLPLVFIDGNSVIITEGSGSYQMTRPYIYHAKGIQRLKNFAGQSLANELENTIQHKFVVAVESVPEDYQDAYQNVQKADVLLYNHFLDTNNPDVILPPPREVVRTPIPPQIAETFRISDEMTQIILGSYDGAAGTQKDNMSGVAFARSAIQSNNASVPYIVGYIKGLNRVAQIIVDMIPQYYRTPRSLPILLPNGKREYMEVNKRGSIYMNYDPNSLQVKVETGVNFAMQKEIALQTIVGLMKTSELFGQFMNRYGLQVLLDNIEIRGIDDLKQKSQEFEKELAEKSKMAMQMQQKQMQIQDAQTQMSLAGMQKELQAPSRGQIDLMKMQQEAAVDAADLSLREREADMDFIELLSKIRSEDVDKELKAAQVEAENTRSTVDMVVSLSSHLNEIENMGKEKE
jgi:Phage P22-like portal protein